MNMKEEFHGRCANAFATGGGDAVVTFKYLADVMDAILDGTKASSRKRDAEIAALNAKISRLEAVLEQRNFAYMGTWKEGRTYNPGQFATYAGAIWHSNVFHNKTRPGDGDASWTLAVKSGRDGRDAKNA